MGRLAIGERGADGELDDILDMGRPHDPRAVGAGIHEQLVELNILLGVGVEEVVELQPGDRQHRLAVELGVVNAVRSEEHTSELQSLMRNSYAVFCLKKKN